MLSVSSTMKLGPEMSAPKCLPRNVCPEMSAPWGLISLSCLDELVAISKIEYSKYDYLYLAQEFNHQKTH